MHIHFKNFKLYIVLIIASFMLFSCGIYKKVDARNIPNTGKAKAEQNVKEGRGVSVKGILNNRSGGSFEFSSSNPLWRASLEILDFLPLSTVDYSGGVIITDWYNDSESSKEYIKITVRFTSNEIRSDSVKVIVHGKKCSTQNNCRTYEQKSKISEELIASILRKASSLEAEDKKRKK